MRITSGFALLDVQNGRKKLAKAIENGQAFPVTITGTIVRQHGSDDGTSIEFQVDVQSVVLVKMPDNA